MKSIHKCFGCLVLMLWILCAGCSATSTDYPAAIMVDGEIYLYSVVPMAGEVDESAIIGYTESYTDEYPSENGQTNFNRELGMPYAKVEDGIAVLFQKEWHMCYPNSEKLKSEIIQTYAAEDKEGRLQTYYEMADGTWGTEEHRYLYKLELTGRMHNAAKDSTFVCLSNSEDISFSEVSKSMISSNIDDRLDRKEVVIVELLIVEEVSPTPTLAPGEDQALPTTMIDGEIYFMYGMYSTVKHSEIERIKEFIEQAEYVGATIDISDSEYPKEELESNCFKEGSKVYRYQEGERVNFIIVKPNELTYSFVDGWQKYRWFEDSIIRAGEQDSYALGMPTPTPTVIP